MTIRVCRCGIARIVPLISLSVLLPFGGAAQSAGTAPEVQFVDATAGSGIEFKHRNGATPEKYMPETMGGGVVAFDYDNDGWTDVFFVDGGSLVENPSMASAGHRLYRNERNGTFRDTTDDGGIQLSGYGMGACAADYDNDGWTDLYITGADGNSLYRNAGGKRFEDVTARAGVGLEGWSASCAFGDIDNDGDVDLYVTRYVDFSVENHRECGLLGLFPVYCHPNVYNSVPDVLFRNRGDGSFSDDTRESGVYRTDGNGLGVVFIDYDDDGWIDIYVANDSVPNFLFHNMGGGTFEEVGFLAGVAVGPTGQPLAGMGTDAGDVDGDGRIDLIVTNLDRETHNVYRNLGAGLFEDITFQSGVGEATLPYVGFGVAFFDYDNDSDLDLAIANGDVIDNVGEIRDDTSYAQINLLLRNDGAGRFTNAGPESGAGFEIRKPSRGLAVADFDNDGDLDLLFGSVGETPDLLRNEGGGERNSLAVRVIGAKSNRDGIGARLRLTVGENVLVRSVKGGSSYLGQNDLRVHFGLGDAVRADRLEILWPGGGTEGIERIEANRILTVREGDGIVAETLLAR